MNFRYNPETADAIERGLPLVALESTVIAHGLPFPRNLETARAIEIAVRAEGAVPATIAVIDGHPSIGLTDEELEYLAGPREVAKISIRDLPLSLSSGSAGATTVASTMFLAHRVGINVFATGGIGGVHRGDAMDISADLPVLASTPMITVCAGAKVVLDLPKTREWLETHGVCVLGWKTDEFPAFYARTSGLKVDGRVESVKEVIEIARSRDIMGMESALLVTAPVPESEEIEADLLEEVLETSLSESVEQGISGKEATPFLLSKLSELTEGKTIDCNVALLLNNARIASKIAVGLGGK
ncbi:MAG: pseudouridine-5'-phosphate glycosidase [Acidobacteriota bacterium]|nr:pseudouridine-5'-phosphate glycosidase [Acidobacteriota bacterium]